MLKKNQYIPPIYFHPGETLAEKLEEMGMNYKEFAVRTGKPERIINAVLNGKSAITPDLAVQFENVTQIPAYFWLNSQRNYDEFMEKSIKAAPIKRNTRYAERELQLSL